MIRIITCSLCMHTEKGMADMSVKNFEFTFSVRRFHVYRDIWLPYMRSNACMSLEALMMYLQSSALMEM